MSLVDLVDYFASYKRKYPRGRGNIPELNQKLGFLEAIAAENGLDHDHLLRLVDAASNGTLAQRVATRLIKCLIPKTTVPQRAVLKAISWMCTNRPASNVQVHLVRWITLVYEHLDGHKDVHALYGTIFYFLENDLMCPYVCHLLYLLTRREDVRLFRVRALINVQKRVGSQPYILGLLSIYKLYCPQLISMTLPRTPKSFFRQPDRAWAGKIKAVQDRNKEEGTGEQQSELSRSFNVSHFEVANLAPAAKRRRMDLVPALDVCTVHTNTWRGKGLSSFTEQKVPLKLIKTNIELLQNIDNIEMPARVASVLKDSLSSHVMSLQTDPVVPIRLGYWVHHILNEEFFHMVTPARKERQAQLLELLSNFSDFLQESMPVWEDFLTRYLLIWNGSDHKELVFRLITRLRLTQSEALLDLVLEPLRKLYFASSVLFKCQVIWCITELLRNYVAVEWPRYKEAIAAQGGDTAVVYSFESRKSFHSVFNEEVDAFPGLQTVKMIIDFVNHISVSSMAAEKNHTMLIHCLADFHGLVTQLYHEWKVPILVLPHRRFVYQLMFSSNIVPLAHLTELITGFRSVFESLRGVSSTLSGTEYLLCAQSLQQISAFNVYLLDICNVIWRKKAFQTSEKKTVFSLIKQQDLERTGVKGYEDAFSLHFHPALLGHCLKFLTVTQPEGRRVHVTDIQKVRDAFLEFLRMENIQAVPIFIAKSIQRKESVSAKNK